MVIGGCGGGALGVVLHHYWPWLGVKPERVRVWIGKGMIKAVNVASKPGEGRPRYRISCEELAKFQTRQAAKLLLAALPQPQRPRTPADFFPDVDG